MLISKSTIWERKTFLLSIAYNLILFKRTFILACFKPIIRFKMQKNMIFRFFNSFYTYISQYLYTFATILSILNHRNILHMKICR
ncbi:Uncharacterised protein [Segatella oris]|uniref:Uncharacterized protein n=1 Tax=Segatella oris TaxID=28135 RepID=A0A3S4TE34_9BACT|nr:Uncharacterised protein [Segatella oris]